MQQYKRLDVRLTRWFYPGLLAVVVLCYCAWVLSLPLFPTQDGPMHLYFTHVLQSLLSEPQGFYSHYYYVRHLFPPYALYYYLLMGLSFLMPVLVADKVVICLYFISFAFGFRYLARAVGPNGDAIALLATILMLNWPLGMGFVNFCLSTSFALWALGLWCRAVASPQIDRRRLIAFVLLAYAIMLTHPVPLLGVFGFCSIDLAIRWIRHRAAGGIGLTPAGWLAQAVSLVLAMGTLAYVKLFTASNMLKQVHGPSNWTWRHELLMLKSYALLHTLTAFAGRGSLDTIYRLIFYALLFVSLGCALLQFVRARKAGRWTVAETWTVTTVFTFIVFPFVPFDLNNSAYFSARLVVYLWITALIAAAGFQFTSPMARRAVAIFTIFATILTLGMARSRITPIARDIATLEQMQPTPEHEVGLLIHSPNYQVPSTTTYDPYFWSGVRMFRRTDSVLYNTPWLDLAIIPLGPRPIMPTYTVSPGDLEYPPGLRRQMEKSPEVRSLILSHIDFALISFGRRRREEQFDSLLSEPATAKEQGRLRKASWNCSIQGTYSVCEQNEP